MALRPVELSQIVGNLLDNAILHGSPPVVVAVDRVDAWARLLVRDEGPGMRPDLLATATRRFTRAPESRARPGFGLGLSLVADITGRANGQLRLCFDGHHEQFGAPSHLPCDHGDQMTVTVLLPVVTSTSPTVILGGDAGAPPAARPEPPVSSSPLGRRGAR